MKLYEFLLTEATTCKMRIKANSPEEAENLFWEFAYQDADYLNEELESNSSTEWNITNIHEVHPSPTDELATITQQGDGFIAQYKGGDEDE